MKAPMTLTFNVKLEADAILEVIDNLRNVISLLENNLTVELPEVKDIPDEIKPAKHEDEAIHLGNMGGGETVEPEGVELANGIPWDARIHSSNHKKHGSAPFGWHYKRGVDKELIPVVEAELRELMTVTPEPETIKVNTGPGVIEEIPVTTPPPPPPGVTAAPLPPPPPVEEPELRYVLDGKQYTYDDLINAKWNDEAIQALPVVEVTNNDETAPTLTWPDVINKITAAQTAKQITKQQLDDALKSQGVNELALLVSRPDLYQTVLGSLNL